VNSKAIVRNGVDTYQYMIRGDEILLTNFPQRLSISDLITIGGKNVKIKRRKQQILMRR
jgi:hypothetical protein